MYHRSDSCIQLGVMNLWFPPLNNMTLSVCFGPPLGTPVFHSCPTKCWCYIILYPVNYILYPMICFFFFFVMKQISVNPEIIQRRLVYLLHPTEVGPAILRENINSIFKGFVMHKAFKTVQDWIQNIQRPTTGGWPTPLKNDGVRQLGSLFPIYGKISFGVIIPNIFPVKVKWNYCSQYMESHIKSSHPPTRQHPPLRGWWHGRGA